MAKGLSSLILLCLMVTTPVSAQQLTANDLVGLWETQWQGAASGATGARPLVEETLEFAKDGTFRRLQRSETARSRVTTMQGTYTVSLAPLDVLASVTIRGTYDGGDRKGQTVSIVLRPTKDTLVATINPPGVGPMEITFTKTRALDDSDVRGRWVGEWTLSGSGSAGPVVNIDTLVFKDGGKFERTIKATNVTAPTIHMDGTYAVDARTVMLRGTFSREGRTGQTASMALKAVGDALELAFVLQGHDPVVVRYRKAT